jgi:hypothetical protein
MTEDLADRAALIDLLGRYFAAVDDKRLDLGIVEASFAEEARLVRPNGSALVGLREILAGQSESFARFRATQHVISDHVVDVVGADVAAVRANLIAMHVWADGQGDPNALERYFVAGGVVRAQARRTGVGWRLTELQMRNVWRSGAGFGAMLKTGASGTRA